MSPGFIKLNSINLPKGILFCCLFSFVFNISIFFILIYVIGNIIIGIGVSISEKGVGDELD